MCIVHERDSEQFKQIIKEKTVYHGIIIEFRYGDECENYILFFYIVFFYASSTPNSVAGFTSTSLSTNSLFLYRAICINIV